MDRIVIRFKLNITHVPTGESQIIDLPHNDDIFQIFWNPELIYIVDANGNAEPYLAFITVVDNDGNELV